MSKRIQLAVANPCHENWDNMTESEKGRFCGSCQKQVIDFTNMTDSQLASFFKKPPSGGVCGRFYADQLDRSIEIPKKRIPWVKYFFQFVLPALLLSIKAAAQSGPKPKSTRAVHAASKGFDPFVRNVVVVDSVERFRTLGFTVMSEAKLAAPLEINGLVLDENDRPVPFASVMVKGTTTGTMANEAGIFKMQKPLKKEVMLQVSSAGYEQAEIPVNEATDLKQYLLARLKIKTENEVVVTAFGHSCSRHFVTSGVVTVMGEAVDTLKTRSEAIDITQQQPVPVDKSSLADINAPKIYPNPVQRSQVVNIEWKNERDEKIEVILIGLNGNRVFSRSQQFNKGRNRLAITIDSRWAAGIYVLQLRNDRGLVIRNEKLVIQ